jgi:dihydroflavonol-4-reductase
MKLLLTGATGLVGNNVLRALLAHGRHEVRVLARNASDKSLAGLDVEIAPGDVRDAPAVLQAAAGCDAIIHSAGVVQLGWSKLAEHRAINVDGTRHMLAAAQANSARLVHISTVDTLGVSGQEVPQTEESPRANKVPCTYVVTKSEAEALVDKAAAVVDAVVIHPGFMLGPWDWKPSSGRMLVTVVEQFTPFAPIGGGSVCDVRDVAEGIIAATERAPRGRHYILAGHNIPYFDLWKQMAAVSGGRPPIMRAGPLMRVIGGQFGDLRRRLTGREGDVNTAGVALSSQWHYYSSERAAQELGYQVRPLEASLRDAWQWLVEYGYTRAPARGA